MRPTTRAAGDSVRRRGEGFHAEQPADGVEGGGNMGVRMGIHTTSDGAAIYDGHWSISFLVEGWHPPADRPSCGSRSLSRSEQPAPARSVGAASDPGSGRQIALESSQKLLQPIHRSDRNPGMPTLRRGSPRGGDARWEAPIHPPCRFGVRWAVSYTHLRAHETVLDLVCRLLL